jgi:hypothetical protein
MERERAEEERAWAFVTRDLVILEEAPPRPALACAGTVRSAPREKDAFDNRGEEDAFITAVESRAPDGPSQGAEFGDMERGDVLWRIALESAVPGPCHLANPET